MLEKALHLRPALAKRCRAEAGCTLEKARRRLRELEPAEKARSMAPALHPRPAEGRASLPGRR